MAETSSTSRLAKLKLRCEVAIDSDPSSSSTAPQPLSLARAASMGALDSAGQALTVLGLLKRQPACSSDCTWTNDRLHKKLQHQLSQPLLVTGGVLPSWTQKLPRRHPFICSQAIR